MADFGKSLLLGINAGSKINDKSDSRKARKLADEQIFGPMQQELGLKLEDKEGIGGFLWDTFGFGDAPKLIKTDERMATEQEATGGPVSPYATRPAAATTAAPMPAAPATQAAIPSVDVAPQPSIALPSAALPPMAAEGTGPQANVPSDARSMAMSGVAVPSAYAGTAMMGTGATPWAQNWQLRQLLNKRLPTTQIG